MAKRIGKYKIGQKEDALSLANGGTSTGAVNLQINAVGSAHADGATLTKDESGKIFFESTDAATITLPATVAGLNYTFIWAGAAGETFNISPNAADTIRGACSDSNAMGTVVESATNGAGTDDKDLQLDSGSEIGNRVTLVGDGSAGWYILDCVGSWAFES